MKCRVDDRAHAALVARVLAALTDDLRRAPWRGNPNPVAGHCYVVSEALLHTIGADEWKPARVHHEGHTHWFLQHRTSGAVIDATADQFTTPVPYSRARAAGFLTRHPSKRARVLLGRLIGRHRD